MNFHLLVSREQGRLHRREAGFTYCDESSDAKTKLQNLYKGVSSQWSREASQLESLIQDSVAAASTDHESQGIDTTLRDDLQSFWSSSGDPLEAVKDETLLYRLKSPHCHVRYVTIAVYRALFQAGHPLYPPLRLRVEVGPSPSTLQPASPWYAVQPDDMKQVFSLRACAPPGGYLRVRLQGKVQQQWEDAQLYIAIRYVAAYGNIVPLHLLARCRQQLPYVLPSRQQVPLQPSAVLQQQALPALPDAVTRHRALALQQRHMQVDPDNWQELLMTEHQQQEQQEQQQGCRSSAEAASSSSGREGSSSSSKERRPSLSESMPQAKSARLSGLLGYISNGCSSLLGARRPGSGAAEGEAAGRKSSSRAQAKPYRPRLRDDVELDPWDDTAADVRSSSSLWGDESADMELEQQLQAQQARGGMPGTSSSGDAAAGIQAAMQLDDSAASQLGGLPFALLLESLQLQQRLNNVDSYSVQERELFMQRVAQFQGELLLGIPLENSTTARHLLASRGLMVPGSRSQAQGSSRSQGAGQQGQRDQAGLLWPGTNALFSEGGHGAEAAGSWQVVSFDEELVNDTVAE